MSAAPSVVASPTTATIHVASTPHAPRTLVEIRTVAGPLSVVQCALIGGPYSVCSHVRQVQVVCPPPCPRQASWPTRTWLGPRGCPFGHRAGGWVIHVPAVVCTSSPNTVKRLTLRRCDSGASGISPPAPPIASAALARTRKRSPAQITAGSRDPGTRSPRHRGRCRSTAQHVDPAS
jgi:hypothetical protein